VTTLGACDGVVLNACDGIALGACDGICLDVLNPAGPGIFSLRARARPPPRVLPGGSETSSLVRRGVFKSTRTFHHGHPHTRHGIFGWYSPVPTPGNLRFTEPPRAVSLPAGGS
jgi:hypothetical protein